MDHPLPTDICPLCGQINHCTQSAEETREQPCWCFSAPVSRHALHRLPDAARNRACLCPRCAAGLAEDEAG
ncbi:cysteine-rich CWC family protein [Pseudomonas sp. RIT-PI-AD]|uniref:cysteine-rich CWC family protein n=1 Tax=Pseudomonas sp. RIT-PI-AD TaxID=3035294 RepID=UPI0021DB7705|nr:cysteine-rich CWC family protein [Pseudomonas sp. RIT-PI-AD]